MNFQPYLGQEYEVLKCKHYESRILFEDNEFPPNEKSLYRFKPLFEDIEVIWKRPSEFTLHPKFINNKKIDPLNIIQGKLENWYEIFLLL
jgi:hypothetical protein